jgi:TonB family protein
MNRLLSFFIFLVFGISNLSAQSAHAYLLRGTVKTPADEIVAGATFCSDGQSATCASSDLDGEFELRLKVGEYVITASKLDAPDFRLHINIADGPLNPDNLSIILDPARYCCRTADGGAFPKAVSIPKPPYPPAAAAVRASGEVLVSVEIDKEGKVISANAAGGHPLLKRAAEMAARSAVFEQSRLVPIRTVVLRYIFFSSEKGKEGLRRYSNPYRIEVVYQPQLLYTVDTYSRLGVHLNSD